jgi:DNA-binding response OmpR family regulator
MAQTDGASERLPIFVVTDDAIASRWLVALFGDPYFHVTLATSFTDAKTRMLERQPALIVTTIQLGEYNGLGLVLRARSRNPEVRAVVLSRAPDPVLQNDAEKLGATFVSLPVQQSELRAAIIRTLFRPEPANIPDPIRAPFERRRIPLTTLLASAPLTPAEAERLRREALFPIATPLMLHLGARSAEA